MFVYYVSRILMLLKMKYLMFFLLMLLFLTSCQKSNEDIAKELIKQSLKENLDDWNSYESVSYGALDSVFSLMETDSTINDVELVLKRLERSFGISSSMLSMWKEDTVRYAQAYNEEFLKWSSLNDSVSYYKTLVENLKSNYQPRFEGFVMMHKFRANNENGVKQIFGMNFYIDSTLNKVVDVNEK